MFLSGGVMDFLSSVVLLGEKQIKVTLHGYVNEKQSKTKKSLLLTVFFVFGRNSSQ